MAYKRLEELDRYWKVRIDSLDNEKYYFLFAHELTLSDVEDVIETTKIGEIGYALDADFYYRFHETHEACKRRLAQYSICIILLFIVSFFTFSHFVMTYMFFYTDGVYMCYMTKTEAILNESMTLPDDVIYHYQSMVFTDYLHCDTREIHTYEQKKIAICNRTQPLLEEYHNAVISATNIPEKKLYFFSSQNPYYSYGISVTTDEEVQNRRFINQMLATLIAWTILLPFLFLILLKKYCILNTCLFGFKVCALKYKNKNVKRARINVV